MKFLRFILFFILIVLIFVFVFYFSKSSLYPLKYEELINKYAKVYNLRASLVAALIKEESSFNPNAVSSAGALGLMQILPSTGSWIAEKIKYQGFKTEDLLNPAVNIKFGEWYLRYLLDRYEENLDLALAAYNSGTRKIDLLKGKTIREEDLFLETSNFIKRVKRSEKIYQKLYGKNLGK